MILEISLFIGSYIVFLGIYYGLKKRATKPQLLATDSDERLLKCQVKVNWCRYLENVGDFGLQLAQQYQTIVKLKSSSISILRQKFQESEITFVRYRQTIEATHDILYDNMLKLIPLLEVLDQDPRQASDMIQKITELLQRNQDLIDKLNALIVNLSEIKTLTGPDQTTTQFLIENLDKHIAQAKHY